MTDCKTGKMFPKSIHNKVTETHSGYFLGGDGECGCLVTTENLPVNYQTSIYFGQLFPNSIHDKRGRFVVTVEFFENPHGFDPCQQLIWPWKLKSNKPSYLDWDDDEKEDEEEVPVEPSPPKELCVVSSWTSCPSHHGCPYPPSTDCAPRWSSVG